MNITDAVIPFHIKDAPILKYGCESLKYILNVENIYIVGSENPNIENTTFIHENDINGIIKLEDIKKQWKEKNENVSHRAGWLYQQFLKLGVDDYIPSLSETFLICDADIIFVNNPYTNIQINEFPYARAYTREYHGPYRDQYSRLMKEETNSGFSFINHHMILNKKYVKELKQYIESINSKKWDISIIDTLDWNEHSNFSEYDLYGNWMFKMHNNICCEKEIKIVDIDRVPSVDELMFLKNNQYHIVSSQAYRRSL
jgi:hypothetical protein